MPGTAREDAWLENIRGRPLKIQHHTQHSTAQPKKRWRGQALWWINGKRIHYRSWNRNWRWSRICSRRQRRCRSRSRQRSAARWATHPYIRPSLPEIFVSLQLHIVDRSVGHIGRLRTVIERYRNESAWVSVRVLTEEKPEEEENKNESVHCRQCLFVRCVQPELGSVPKWTSRTPKSAALCPAHYPRKDTRRQGVSLCTVFECKIWLIMFLVIFQYIATSSRGETRSWRVWRRIGWLPGTTAADAAWTPCRWRPVSRTNGLSNVLSVKM